MSNHDGLWDEARELDDAYPADTKNDAARMARLALVTHHWGSLLTARAGAAEARVADLEAEVDGLRAVEQERDDLSDRMSELICDLTDGMLSKPNYTVRAMVQQVEQTFTEYTEAETSAAKAAAWDEGAQATYEWCVGATGKPANPYRENGAR